MVRRYAAPIQRTGDSIRRRCPGWMSGHRVASLATGGPASRFRRTFRELALCLRVANPTVDMQRGTRKQQHGHKEETAKVTKAARPQGPATGRLSVGQGQVGRRTLGEATKRTAVDVDKEAPGQVEVGCYSFNFEGRDVAPDPDGTRSSRVDEALILHPDGLIVAHVPKSTRSLGRSDKGHLQLGPFECRECPPGLTVIDRVRLTRWAKCRG